MAPAERRRACASSGASARASALAQLTSLRQQGGRRVDSFELKLEDKIYDTLPEADYNLLVAKRRQAAKEFVVEDNGLGYDDVGEEEDWEVDVRPESSDEEDRADSKAKKPKSKASETKKEPSNKKASSLSAAAALLGKQRVPSMFAAASGVAALRRAPTSAAKGALTADNVLEDVLADITVDDSDRERERLRRRGLGPKRSAFSMPAPIDQPPQSKPTLNSMSEKPTMASVENICKQETLAPLMGQDTVTENPMTIDYDEASVLEIPYENGNESGSLETVANDKVSCRFELPETKDHEHDKTEPAASIKQEVEVKSVLNAKLKLRTASDNKASAPWHTVSEPGMVKAVKDEAEEEGVPFEGSEIPLDPNGNLTFFLIDAYEEAFGSNPGTIFLFGKVHTGSKYVSCCVIVRNMQRCVYAVPSPSVFPRNIIAGLEEDCKSGGSSRIAEFSSKLQDMAKELKAELAQRLLDMDVESFRMAPVKRSYAFENPDVPAGEHYVVKLSYAFKDAPLPADLKGAQFSTLLGTHTSALELFLIKKRIRGPSWLSISKPTFCTSSSQVSWCKMEVIVESPKDIFVTPPGEAPQKPPPVVVAALNLKTVVNHKHNTNEIASASVVYCRKVKIDMPMPQAEWNTREMLSHFSIVRKLDGGIFPMGFNTEVAQINSKAGSNVLSLESSERALLNHLMIKLHQLDPDVLVGHNISGFDIDVLLHRMQACKVQSNIWSKIGRLKRSSMPKLTGGATTFGAGAGLGALACIAGRLLCDTYLASRDLLKEVSYTLSQLAKSQLGRERRELTPMDIPTMYQSSASLVEMVECGETDAWLALGLMFRLSVLPLTRQLTNISGNLWGKTLQGARAQRVEYLLLHEFHSRKYVVPDKLTARDKENLAQKRKAVREGDDFEGDAQDDEAAQGKRKRGPAYMGGLVLEPKKGLYDKFILLLDFNSLYPSIIQEYNICFTTVRRPSDGSLPALPSTDVPGVLPQILKSLVERRRQVKTWLKQTSDQLKYQQLDIQQQALKLTANSMYGCLGFSNSRFYAKSLAELITSQGRDILQNTVDLVQNSLNLEVIYGDTDSIMIHTGMNDLQVARSIAIKTIKEVNKKYKLLEIDLDGIFKRMLLLKKKKYAAVKVEANGDGTFREVIEQKGLDIVRRDWSLISKEIGNFCLEQILSGGSCEDVVETIHNQLRKLQEEMRSGQIELEKYVITKSLTKAPEAYPDAKNQPHVQVALRLKEAGHRIGCSVGDTVPYIISIEQGSNSGSPSIAERARHPDELKNDPGNWLVDIDYYLSQQIHPVVSRLCAPIEGTDARHLAECLGLDPSKFQAKSSTAVVEKDEVLLSASAVLDDDDRYRHCASLQLVCPSCSNRYTFPGVSQVINVMQESATSETTVDNTSKQMLPEDYIQCPKCRDNDGVQRVSAAILANQVKQRAEEFIGRYYEGWMECDDEMCGYTTRGLNLRVMGDSERGAICPNYPRCNGHLVRQYTEVDLYKQLTHFCRLLEVDRALEKVSEANARVAAEKRFLTLKRTVGLAAQIITAIRDRCAYRWVRIEALCISLS